MTSTSSVFHPSPSASLTLCPVLPTCWSSSGFSCKSVRNQLLYHVKMRFTPTLHVQHLI